MKGTKIIYQSRKLIAAAACAAAAAMMFWVVNNPANRIWKNGMFYASRP